MYTMTTKSSLLLCKRSQMKTPTGVQIDLSAAHRLLCIQWYLHSADAEILETAVGHTLQTDTEDVMNLFVCTASIKEHTHRWMIFRNWLTGNCWKNTFQTTVMFDVQEPKKGEECTKDVYETKASIMPCDLCPQRDLQIVKVVVL